MDLRHKIDLTALRLLDQMKNVKADLSDTNAALKPLEKEQKLIQDNLSALETQVQAIRESSQYFRDLVYSCPAADDRLRKLKDEVQNCKKEKEKKLATLSKLESRYLQIEEKKKSLLDIETFFDNVLGSLPNVPYPEDSGFSEAASDVLPNPKSEEDGKLSMTPVVILPKLNKACSENAEPDSPTRSLPSRSQTVSESFSECEPPLTVDVVADHLTTKPIERNVDLDQSSVNPSEITFEAPEPSHIGSMFDFEHSDENTSGIQNSFCALQRKRRSIFDVEENSVGQVEAKGQPDVTAKKQKSFKDLFDFSDDDEDEIKPQKEECSYCKEGSYTKDVYLRLITLVNLNSSVKVATDLHQIFKEIGRYKILTVHRKSDKSDVFIGHVLYFNRKSADAAVRRLNAGLLVNELLVVGHRGPLYKKCDLPNSMAGETVYIIRGVKYDQEFTYLQSGNFSASRHSLVNDSPTSEKKEKRRRLSHFI